eukprot:COSAG02_NODE_246_length_27291_cov_105.654200_10_plen_124_part_00
MEQPRSAKRPRAETLGVAAEDNTEEHRPAAQTKEGAAGAAEALHVHSTGVREEDMPPVFLAWLAENRIDPRVYTLNAKLPRYVRRNPRLGQPSAEEISAQLGVFSHVLQMHASKLCFLPSDPT